MANGTLGKAVTLANNTITPYTVPSTALFATISINACNMNAIEDAVIKIAITTSSTPSPEDYVEFGAVVPAAGGTLERTCIVVSANEKVHVYSDKASVAVRVYGLEELQAQA